MKKAVQEVLRGLPLWWLSTLEGSVVELYFWFGNCLIVFSERRREVVVEIVVAERGPPLF